MNYKTNVSMPDATDRSSQLDLDQGRLPQATSWKMLHFGNVVGPALRFDTADYEREPFCFLLLGDDSVFLQLFSVEHLQFVRCTHY